MLADQGWACSSTIGKSASRMWYFFIPFRPCWISTSPILRDPGRHPRRCTLSSPLHVPSSHAATPCHKPPAVTTRQGTWSLTVASALSVCEHIRPCLVQDLNPHRPWLLLCYIWFMLTLHFAENTFDIAFSSSIFDCSCWELLNTKYLYILVNVLRHQTT